MLALLGCLTDNCGYEIHRFLPARMGGQELLDRNSYLDVFNFGIVSIQILGCMIV